MSRNLTFRQRELLLDACQCLGISKGRYHGTYWRNFDQLERRRLIAVTDHRKMVYHATDAGKQLACENCPCGGFDCSAVPGGPLLGCPYTALLTEERRQDD